MSTILKIHEPIMEKLQYFYDNHKIPNIIFHGQSGCGKKTIVQKFINMIYNNDRERQKHFVMHVNSGSRKRNQIYSRRVEIFCKDAY